MASSFPKMQKRSASFSQSIRNRLRLKKLQAQAKNFCRVLDIRVPEIVKTNVPQSIGFQKLRKLFRHIMGLDKITNLVDADITCILFVVGLPAEPSVVILLRFDSKQPFLDERHQRKGSHTGLGFGGICRHENVLIK